MRRCAFPFFPRASSAEVALAGTLAFAFAVGLARESRGDVLPIHLDYRAPSSCPDEATLLSRIRTRIEVRRATPGEAVPTFGISLQTEGASVVGRISSIGERREPTSRVVSGGDCADVVDAVALIVAMALAPSGSPAAWEGARAGAKVDPSAESAPPGEREALEKDAGSSSENIAPSATREARPRWHLLGSGLAEATLGYVPTPLFAAGARLQVFRSASYVGGPSIALGFAAVQPTERQMAQGRASLSFDVGELFACPVAFALGDAWHALPCVRLDAGQVEGTGADIPNAHAERRLWSSAGLLGQLIFVPAKPVVLDAEASLLFPLTPYEFTFAPQSVIYAAPRVGFSASLAVGLMFL
jgi:hypothetical protein